MLSEAKFTEIYCMADDICKKNVYRQKKYMVEDEFYKYRNKLGWMRNIEIMGDSPSPVK